MQIHIDEIILPDEWTRTSLSEASVDKLAADILENGLINPPTVRKKNGIWYLTAGKRRYCALRKLFAEKQAIRHGTSVLTDGYIEVVDFGDLSPIEALKLEMSENIQREELSWQDRAVAADRLDRLVAEVAEMHGETHTTAATVQAALGDKVDNGYRSQEVRNFLELAKHLDDPAIANARNMKEAQKALINKQMQLVRAELGARFSTKTTQHTLLNVDSLAWMKEHSANVFDIIVADPPYGIDMHENAAQSNSLSGVRHTYDDSLDYATSCVTTLATEGVRITKPDSHVYMFCDIELWWKWRVVFEAVGWYVWPKPIIWHKSNAGSLLGDANGPRHCYEAILFAKRGGKACKVRDDVIVTQAGDNSLHSANKPVDVYTNIFSRSAIPGDKVLDPFCGSALILKAAAEFHITITALEKDPAHFATAQHTLLEASNA